MFSFKRNANSSEKSAAVRRADCQQRFDDIEQWFDSPRGRFLLDQQSALLDRQLQECFGYYLLQLSVCRQLDLASGARVLSKFRCQSGGELAAESVVAELPLLPFACDSLDAVIVHHCHEFVDSPQQLLRELQRVIVNGGHLIIVGFNPFSALAITQGLRGVLPGGLWHNHRLSSRRLEDWLQLLGFRLKSVDFSPLLPASSNLPHFISSSADRLSSWPVGASYCICAVKQPLSMTPITPNWRQMATSLPGLNPVKSGANAAVNTRGASTSRAKR